MFCTKCGSELADDVRFCPKCGSPNARAAQAGAMPQPQPVPVPVPAPAPIPDGAPNPAPKRSKGRIAVLVVACVLVLGLAGAGFFFYAKANMGGAFGMTFVNAAAFPDEGVRAAVSAQLDSDGDGILTADETATVARIELTGGTIVLGRAGEVPEEGASEGEGGEGESESTGEGGASNAGAGGQAIGSLAGIENFPNITTLNCRDAGLAELDLSRNPALEHVDCRGNNFSTLDLSANTALTALLCDPEVEVTGLGQAGLYFTDLITGASCTRPESSSGSSSYAISYDADGRPISVSTEAGEYSSATNFAYDEAGRLTEADDGLYRFTYDEAGRLAKYDSANVGAYSTSFHEEYAYDDRGYLVQKTSNSESPVAGMAESSTVVYEYNGDRLAKTSENGSRTSSSDSYAFDEAGRLIRWEAAETGISNAGSSSSLQTTVASYSEMGSCTETLFSQTYKGPYSSASSESGSYYRTEYDGNGYPVRTVYNGNSGAPMSTVITIEYTCNRDGYVTKAVSTSNSSANDFRDGQVIELSYMKMVGSLDDRASRRFVPQYRFQTEDTRHGITQFWFQGNGSLLGATVVETLPHHAVERGLGLELDAVSVPNEVQLAAYDREHGTMTVAVEAPASAAPSSPAEEPAAQPEPVKIETEYFTAELPAAWADKIEVIYGTDYSPDTVTVSYKGFPEVSLLSFNVVDASQPVVGGDIGSANMWHADASGGKRIELWAARYPILFWSDAKYANRYGNDSRLSSLSDAQKEEVLLLNTGQPLALSDVLAAESEQEIAQNYATLVDTNIAQTITPTITVR